MWMAPPTWTDWVHLRLWWSPFSLHFSAQWWCSLWCYSWNITGVDEAIIELTMIDWLYSVNKIRKILEKWSQCLPSLIIFCTSNLNGKWFKRKNIYIVCMLIRCLIFIKIVWMLYYLFLAIKMKFELHECRFKILLRPESIRLENVQK